MKVTTGLVWLLSLTAGVYANNSDSKVQVLTDANFEADTQAATGGTAGDWFVMFYAPWCGHCEALLPTWDELASVLADEGAGPNVAKFDVTQSSVVRSRFGSEGGLVRGYPTLLYFTMGKVHVYKGKRTLESLKAFAEGGYKKTEALEVPAPQNVFVSSVLQSSAFKAFAQFMESAVNDIIQIAEQRRSGAIILVISGLLAGSLVTSIIFVLLTPPPRQPRAKAQVGISPSKAKSKTKKTE